MSERKCRMQDIHLNQDNPRTITKDAFEVLVNSLLIFPKGIDKLMQIAVDENGMILAGNMRYRALAYISGLAEEDVLNRLEKLNGWNKRTEEEKGDVIEFWKDFLEKREVTVKEAYGLSEAERDMYIVMDNQEAGEWDMDALANLWDDADLRDWGITAYGEVYEQAKHSVDDEFMSEMAETTDENCKMPIVPEFNEKHECFVIVVHNKIDEGFVRDVFGLQENHASNCGDGKERRCNVIDVSKLREVIG